MANAQSELLAWWNEVRALLQSARLALGAADTTDVLKKISTGGPGLKGLVGVVQKNPGHYPEINAPVPASTPAMVLPEIQKKAIELALRYPHISARLKASGFSPLPPLVAPSPSGTVLAPAPSSSLPLAEPPSPSWPSPPASQPQPPRKEPNPEVIRKRQRKALALRFGPPAGESTTAPPPQEQAPEPWSASLELTPQGDGWALTLVVEPLLGLPGFCKKLRLASGGSSVELLGSNLRSGVSRIPVIPSLDPYRIEAPGFEDELGALLAPLEQPGFSPSRATLFLVRVQGHATRSSSTKVPLSVPVLVLVPPALSAVKLPEGSCSLPGGFRVLPMRLEWPLAPEKSELLNALGLQAGESGIRVRWAGASAIRYLPGHDGTAYPCFSEPPIVELERTGTAQRLWLLLTSEKDETELRLEAASGNTLVSPGELPAGSYALDILGETPESSERLFFSVGEAAPLPAALVVAHPAERDAVTLGHPPPELDVELRSLQLEFHAPPGWELFARWSGRTSRVLGKLTASAKGIVAASDVRDLLAAVSGEQAGDVEISAGELGGLVLAQEAELDGEAVVDAIVRLVHERWSSLEAISGDAGLLRTILVAPVVELLGYEIESTALAAAEGAGWRLVRTVREGRTVASRREELLVVLPPGILRPEPPSRTQRKRWQEVLRANQLQRALLTDGRYWTVVGRAQRLMLPPVDLGSTGVLEARGPVDLLLRVVQP